MPLNYQASNNLFQSPLQSLGNGGNGGPPTDPFGNFTSLLGTGLAIGNQQQAYSGLQNALNTIGPTQLSNNQLTGPGGMQTGYTPGTGAGNINLGGLNPAFSGFSGAAGAGAGGYNAGLPYGLSNASMSTLNPALSNLFGAYGNAGAGMNAANQQLGSFGNFNNNYNNLLSQYQNQLAPQIQQSAYGLQNTLFGNGVADSTGAASGSLAAQNFGRGVGQATSNAQLNAFQGALGAMNSGVQNYGQLSSAAGGILNNAFNNFGNTNQLISGLNTAGLTNAATAAQGAGALNTVGLNNYNAGLQSSLASATARNQSLFPYASVANSLAGTQNGMGLLGSALGMAGANGGMPFLNQIGQATGLTGPNGILSSMFGNGNNTGPFSGFSPNGTYTDAAGNLMSGEPSFNAGNSIGDLGTNWGGTVDLSQSAGALGGGFSPAGGAAASGAAAYGLMPGAAPAAAGAGTAGAVDTSMQLAPMFGPGTSGIAGANAAVGGADAGASAGSSGAAGLGSMALPLAALGATYWAGGRGTNVNTSGLMSALQAGPNGNPNYSSDVLQASSLAGNWGGAQGGYGGLNVDASGLQQWLQQNGYGTPLANLNPNTPWSSNPYRTLGN